MESVNVKTSDENVDHSEYAIDLNSRSISVPVGEILGVETDTGVDTKKFRVDRYYNGIDLSTFSIRMNVMNAEDAKNIYSIENVVVDGEYLTFGWIPDSFVTAKDGTALISISFVRSEDGVIEKKISTKPIGLKVFNGQCFESEAVEKDPDIVAEILSLRSLKFYIEDGCLMMSRRI